MALISSVQIRLIRSSLTTESSALEPYSIFLYAKMFAQQTSLIKHMRLDQVYQRSLRRLTKAELDLGFLRKCKGSEVYPKFVRSERIKQLRRKKKQHRFHKLLLNDAINERNTDILRLRKTTCEQKAAILDILQTTTWMKAKLIIFSVNRLMCQENKKISSVF